MKICLAERASVKGVTISLLCKREVQNEWRFKYPSPCNKVEDKTKSDADRKGGQCASEECQKDEGEAEPDEDCYEAGKGRVPVPVAASLTHLYKAVVFLIHTNYISVYANQDWVEDEVAKSKLHPSVLFIFFHLLSS